MTFDCHLTRVAIHTTWTCSRGATVATLWNTFMVDTKDHKPKTILYVANNHNTMHYVCFAEYLMAKGYFWSSFCEHSRQRP